MATYADRMRWQAYCDACYQARYNALKQAGHSAVKAAEVLLDARCGDEYARQWVRAI